MEGRWAGAELWRLTMEHSPVGMALVDLDGRLLRCNRALSEILGYDAEELMARDFQEITHPDDLDADLALFHQTLNGEIDSYRLRKRYLHAEGFVVWGDLSVALVRDPQGRPLHFVSQILDVTEQRDKEHRLQEANAELEHERQALQAIFETVGIGLLLIGPDGSYQRMNRRHRETMSLPFPDGHDGQAGQLGHVYYLDGTTAMAREDMPSYRATQGEEFDDLSFWVGHDPLTRTAFSVSARQVRSPSGERLGAALAYQEVTDLMRAMQAKDQFVSSVSHELRTPLTSILGHVEMMGDRVGLPPDLAAQLRVVHRNTVRLRALVSDLLHVAQAEEGSLALQRAEVDLCAVVIEAVDSSRPAAESAQVSVEVDVPGAVPALVDAHRIRQVLDNLISNAVKYTEPGGRVRVRGRRTPHTVEIEVHDTGIGIGADEVGLVFSRFFRGGGALGRQITGTGLGLNIVNSIVKAHGGSVTLESQEGVGSTFRVSLPQHDL